MILTLIIINSCILAGIVLAIREVRQLVKVQKAGLEKYRKNKARRESPITKIIAEENAAALDAESGANHGY